MMGFSKKKENEISKQGNYKGGDCYVFLFRYCLALNIGAEH